MDGFWPVRSGSSSTLWNALSGPLRPGSHSGHLTASMAVCLFTGGWEPIEWAILMCWASNGRHPEYVSEVMAAYADHEAVQEAAKVNTLSVVRADGLDWIRVVAGRTLNYRGRVPVWSGRALRDLRDERGCKAKDLWRELDVRPAYAKRVAGWHGSASSRRP